MIHYHLLDTPLGTLRLVSDGKAVTRIEFEDQHSDDGEALMDEVLQECARQLLEYFAGERQSFQLSLSAEGTEFQRQVWSELCNIPFGELCSYRDIAERIGNRKAVRAVGAANGKNPIPIIVPCHRVIGSDGSLTGFGGGLAAKQQLLQLEQAQLQMPV